MKTILTLVLVGAVLFAVTRRSPHLRQRLAAVVAPATPTPTPIPIPRRTPSGAWMWHAKSALDERPRSDLPRMVHDGSIDLKPHNSR